MSAAAKRGAQAARLAPGRGDRSARCGRREHSFPHPCPSATARALSLPALRSHLSASQDSGGAAADGGAGEGRRPRRAFVEEEESMAPPPPRKPPPPPPPKFYG